MAPALLPDSVPDPPQAIRADLQRRAADASGQADRHVCLEQHHDRFAGRFKELREAHLNRNQARSFLGNELDPGRKKSLRNHCPVLGAFG